MEARDDTCEGSCPALELLGMSGSGCLNSLLALASHIIFAKLLLPAIVPDESISACGESEARALKTEENWGDLMCSAIHQPQIGRLRPSTLRNIRRKFCVGGAPLHTTKTKATIKMHLGEIFVGPIRQGQGKASKLVKEGGVLTENLAVKGLPWYP
jgi:hypothetical protein